MKEDFKGIKSIEIKPNEGETGGVKSSEVEEIGKVAFESPDSKIVKLDEEIAIVEKKIKGLKKKSEDFNNTNFKESDVSRLNNIEGFIKKRNQNEYDSLIKEKDKLELEKKLLIESN